MNPYHLETIEYIKAWAAIITPILTMIVSGYVAIRVNSTHALVNTQMDEFKRTMGELSDSRTAESFSAGQENIRSRNRNIVETTGRAVQAAGTATTAAGQAVVAAANLTQPYTPENHPGRRATDAPRET